MRSFNSNPKTEQMMKKIVFTLLILSTLVMQAKPLEHGSHWYNGVLIFEATLHQGGNIVINAMDEGQEMEFMLVPVKGKPETYRIAHGSNDAMMIYENCETAKHVQQEGLDVICLYNHDGELYTIFSKLTENDAGDHQQLNIEHWMATLRGRYTMQDGTQVTIDWTKAHVGGTYIPIEPVTFNSHITGVMSFDGDGTPLNGTMEVEPTIDGLRLYPVAFDEYGGHHRLGDQAITLTESDPNSPRFDYANHTLLHGNELYDYSPEMLRVMRNSIYARHGHVFQTADLKDYFSHEPWYKPVNSNESQKLSLLEQLNVDIIKMREAELKKENKN